MNRIAVALLAGAGLFLPGCLRADEAPQLSAGRLDLLDQRGYFTPAFKTAVHHLVEAQQALAQTRDEEKKLRASVPDLQRQEAEAQAEIAALRKELALYEHPEDSDYDALQSAMKDPAATPENRLMLAQAFVWSYPTDPRQAEAEQDLQQIQKQLSDQRQAAKDAEAARAAAHARLVQGAAAHNLSLAAWQDFLRDMSQEEVLAQLGRPASAGEDYWLYTGAWTTNPATGAKNGLRIHFNGTRVMSVFAAPPQ